MLRYIRIRSVEVGGILDPNLNPNPDRIRPVEVGGILDIFGLPFQSGSARDELAHDVRRSAGEQQTAGVKSPS